jgi:uncharacterized protein YneF (UPF0154 family)
MVKNMEEILKESERILPSEEMIVEVMRDIMKDEVKAYIREKMDENPKIKEEIRSAMLTYISAKVKELEATTKLTKALGELGIISLPPDVKKELVANMYQMFQKEIDEILEKTL